MGILRVPYLVEVPHIGGKEVRQNRALCQSRVVLFVFLAAFLFWASGCQLLGPSGKKPSIEQVLRYAIIEEPSTVDPQLASSADEIRQVSLNFSSLMTFDENLRPTPALAERVDVSAIGLTYIFVLRPGLSYSDGTPIKASDFQYAWLRMLDPDVGAKYGSIAYAIQGAEEYHRADPRASRETKQRLRDQVGIKAPDDRTLVFQLKSPAPYFLSIAALWIGTPVQQEIVERQGKRWTEPGKHPSNGPFVLRRWEKPSPKLGPLTLGPTDRVRKIVYEANPNYYQGRPTLDRIELFIFDDFAEAFQAYLRDELDMLTTGGGLLPLIEQQPILQEELIRWPGSCTNYLAFNLTKKPFDNPKIRQAFAQAIDREKYVREFPGEAGLVAQGFIPPGILGHQKGLVVWPLDLQKAKQALAEGGYQSGKDLGRISMPYPEGTQPIMEWLAGQLEENLGVEIRLERKTPSAYAAMLRSPETSPPLFFAGWCADYPDPQNILSLVFYSKSTVSPVRWQNRQFDELVEQADRELDSETRLKLYQQAEEVLLREVPVIPMYYGENLLLKKPWVKGLMLSPMDTFPGQLWLENIFIDIFLKGESPNGRVI